MTDTALQDRRDEKRPATGEAPFDVGEVFYSRTDQRGVILAGNYVFRRVADYDWDQLIGAPHKIIRHPDMPKGVFHILWAHILSGRSVGAYVKNRAADGLYYWVYALVTPWEDQILSVRIKPTSPLLKTVETLYTQIRARENAGELSPEDSAAAIEAALAEMGFPTYDDFASHALSAELTAERAHLGLDDRPHVRQSAEILSQVAGLSDQASSLLKCFAALRSVPRNLQVKAKIIEPSGGPLTALSNDYGLMSQEMATWFADNVVGQDNNFARIARQVKNALYCNTVQEILNRCTQQFELERRHMGEADVDAEREVLTAITQAMKQEARGISASVIEEAEHLQKVCKRMDRSLMGLNTVRVTGKIENARLGTDSLELGDIINQLGRSQDRVEAALREVQNSIATIAAGIRVLCADPGEHYVLGLLHPKRKQPHAAE